MQVDIIKKEPSEEYAYALNYQDEYAGAEVISTSKVTAFDLTDDVDATADVLENTGGPPPDAELLHSTATGGSTTTLIDTTKDFAALGVRPGHEFYNVTKKRRVTVVDIESTTNPYDTLVFEEQSVAFAAADSYKFFFAKALLIAGEADHDYKITWVTTSSKGRVHEDSIRIQLRDY